MAVDIFGPAWNDVTLEHVETFLADAGSESLTWEAKGTDLPRTASIAKHVCGFANSNDGGYLLLGVERAGDAWQATGLEFPNDDPPAWVSGIVGTLRPRPRVDVRDWQVGARRVAVVQVQPVAGACMTRDGQVFERVSGATVPVTDPAELARLFARGEAAADNARREARNAMEERAADTDGFVRTQVTFVFALAIAATTYPDDLERLLFNEQTRLFLGRRFRESLKPDRHRAFQGGPQTRVRQDGIVAWMAGNAVEWRWSVTVSRGGAVAVTASQNRPQDDGPLGIGVFTEDVMQPAWTVAADLAKRLGASGKTAARVRTMGSATLAHRDNFADLPPVDFEEWTAEPQPTRDELEHVQRQLLRAAGFDEWEPD